MFNSVEFVCKYGDSLYFIGNHNVGHPGVVIDSFAASGHECTDPGIEILPVFRPNRGGQTIEYIRDLVEQGKMLPEALTIAVELSL